MEQLQKQIDELKSQIQKQNSVIDELLDNKSLYFTYTDDEYGEFAKDWHKKNGMPSYVYDGDAGFDLPTMLSSEDQKHGHKVVWPGERELLHTGIKIQLPPRKYGRIVHRSSTEKRHRLRIVEGTIDNAFRGALFIQVHNTNPCHLEIYHGNRYAQLIVCSIHRHKIEYAEKLNETTRGILGYGSSGI
jgi:dUTP pyrophosphatase